uniref:GDP-mannose 4,6-dehydratase n=1 Tax=viral metagenome TaxID=1070528 RepID=A0A6C0KIF0_9ZZZZ
MKLAFITGITGQDGSYLAELLLKKNYKVYGIVRRTSLLYSHSRIDHIRNKINLEYGDMSDGSSLTNYITKIVYDNKDFEVFEIYNLAAQSHVKISFEIPEYTSIIDGIGTLKLLEAIRTFPKEIMNKIRFYQAGTSEMYGKVLETPQSETTPFNPQSPYACAKLYSHFLVKNYRDGYGMYACNGILFNHESPRRGENFLTMKVVNAVKDIANNKKEFIQLGNLNSKRDWGHSKDYVYGMWLMLQQDEPDDYVLATGETYTVKEFVKKAFAYMGYTISWKGEHENELGIDQYGITRVKINPKYYRPCEVDLLLGNPSKAQNKLGWKREYETLNSLIADMFS